MGIDLKLLTSNSLTSQIKINLIGQIPKNETCLENKKY